MLKARYTWPLLMPCLILSVPKSESQSPQAAPALNSVDATADQTYFNGRPMPPNAYRVLFIGDSLTYHAKTPNVWNYNSGMAATSAAKDFVHLAAGDMQTKLGSRPVEIMLDNGGNGRIGTMLLYLQNHPEIQPHLVVLQGGENDAFDDTFRANYRALLDFFRVRSVPYIVLGDWWVGEKSKFEQQEVSARGYAWIDLTVFDKTPGLTGYGGPYNLPAVAKHPNDKGMKAIADAILMHFDRCVLPSVKHVQ